MIELANEAESKGWPAYIAEHIAAASARVSRLVGQLTRERDEARAQRDALLRQVQALQTEIVNRDIAAGRPLLPFRAGQVRVSSTGSHLDAEP